MTCEFIKINGERCKANVIRGSKCCFTHNPEYKEAKSIAVRKGGLNRKHYEAYGEPVVIKTPKDIKKLLSSVISGVWTGKVPANQPANTIGFLSRCFLDAYKIADLEERIDAIERKLESLEK